MKPSKFLLFIVFSTLLFIIGCGCSSSQKESVENAIVNELDLLKKLDSAAVEKYIDYQNLLPAANTEETDLTQMKDIFSLYFKDFDYSISDITIHSDDKTKASAILLLTTIDAALVAKDFAAAELQQHIRNSIKNQNNTDSNYLIFYNVLSSNSYPAAEKEYTVELQQSKDSSWELVHDYALEDALTGGLLSDLSETLLLPSEVIDIYFSSFLALDEEELAAVLGINSDDSSQSSQIAKAILKQLDQHFSYKILDESIKDDTASVEVEFTTFNGDAITDAYQTKLDAYLASADAVIDGSQNRIKKSQDILIKTINENKATLTNTQSISLIKENTSWYPEIDSDLLSTALFGNLNSFS